MPRMMTLLALSLITLLYALSTKRRPRCPAPPRWAALCIAAIPCYMLFQLVPLPISAIDVLSPARGSLIAALGPVIPGISRAPLSVNPPATVLMMFTIVGYLVVYLLVRELSWRFAARPWQTLIPIICLGGLEAAYGMSQVWQATENPRASGSFSNWDHFSGFLELTLPLSVVFGSACLRRNDGRGSDSTARAAVACAIWAISVLTLIAIVYSLCRTGFLVALVSVFCVVALCLDLRGLRQVWRWLSIAGLALVTAALFVVLQPSQLIERFAGLSSGNGSVTDSRPILWKETCSLISEFPWFGVGSGGFQSAFLKHQEITVTTIVEFAHNDYLQYLADFGFVGYVILIAGLVGVLIPLLRPLRNAENRERRFVAIACAGSLIALALHSLADFNSFVPATSMTMAWILGAGSANGTTRERFSLS